MSKRILRVDMTNLEAKFEDLPTDFVALGGRALTSTIVSKEVDPLCHPLGAYNKLVFAPGLVTGSKAPTSGRMSVGAKSPLTGGIKEANVGTNFAQKLGRMRIAAIIIEGKYKGEDYYLLKITTDGTELM
ncbi:MAG: aldehyde ferredoxin oxidoreductase, partial [Candidatus Lokiarchaeota archaeon]|nr:aldehyde ferredoxin oxidoreductase [Candidatus Lokiarchaeota archaeon]